MLFLNLAIVRWAHIHIYTLFFDARINAEFEGSPTSSGLLLRGDEQKKKANLFCNIFYFLDL